MSSNPDEIKKPDPIENILKKRIDISKNENAIQKSEINYHKERSEEEREDNISSEKEAEKLLHRIENNKEFHYNKKKYKNFSLKNLILTLEEYALLRKHYSQECLAKACSTEPHIFSTQAAKSGYNIIDLLDSKEEYFSIDLIKNDSLLKGIQQQAIKKPYLKDSEITAIAKDFFCDLKKILNSSEYKSKTIDYDSFITLISSIEEYALLSLTFKPKKLAKLFRLSEPVLEDYIKKANYDLSDLVRERKLYSLLKIIQNKGWGPYLILAKKIYQQLENILSQIKNKDYDEFIKFFDLKKYIILRFLYRHEDLAKLLDKSLNSLRSYLTKSGYCHIEKYLAGNEDSLELIDFVELFENPQLLANIVSTSKHLSVNSFKKIKQNLNKELDGNLTSNALKDKGINLDKYKIEKINPIEIIKNSKPSDSYLDRNQLRAIALDFSENIKNILNTAAYKNGTTQYNTFVELITNLQEYALLRIKFNPEEIAQRFGLTMPVFEDYLERANYDIIDLITKNRKRQSLSEIIHNKILADHLLSSKKIYLQAKYQLDKLSSKNYSTFIHYINPKVYAQLRLIYTSEDIIALLGKKISSFTRYLEKSKYALLEQAVNNKKLTFLELIKNPELMDTIMGKEMLNTDDFQLDPQSPSDPELEIFHHESQEPDTPLTSVALIANSGDLTLARQPFQSSHSATISQNLNLEKMQMEHPAAAETSTKTNINNKSSPTITLDQNALRYGSAKLLGDPFNPKQVKIDSKIEDFKNIQLGWNSKDYAKLPKLIARQEGQTKTTNKTKKLKCSTPKPSRLESKKALKNKKEEDASNIPLHSDRSKNKQGQKRNKQALNDPYQVKKKVKSLNTFQEKLSKTSENMNAFFPKKKGKAKQNKGQQAENIHQINPKIS